MGWDQKLLFQARHQFWMGLWCCSLFLEMIAFCKREYLRFGPQELWGMDPQTYVYRYKELCRHFWLFRPLFVIVCFPLLRFQDTLCCDNGPIPVLSSILRAPAMGVLFLRHSSGYLFNATMCPIIKQSLYKSLQHIVRHCSWRGIQSRADDCNVYYQSCV